MPLRRFLYLCLLLLGALRCLPAWAVTVDEAARALAPNRRVYDFADVLSPAEEARLDAELRRLEASGLVEGAIVLAPSVEDATPREFATELFRRWGIGDRTKDNGFLLLVTFQPRRYELETGFGLEGVLPDAEADRILRRELVPALRSGRYAEGLSATVAAISGKVEAAGGVEATPKPPTAAQRSLLWAPVLLLLGGATLVAAFLAWPRGARLGHDPARPAAILLGFGTTAAAGFASAQIPQAATGMLLASLPALGFALFRLLEPAWLPIPLERVEVWARRATWAYGLAAAALFLVWLFTAPSGWIVLYLLLAVPFGVALRRALQRAPRRCPECRGPLRWLPEAEEPKFLQPEENVEQQLGGVEYDIWRCDRCSRSAVMRHTRLFADVETCPRCGRRTLLRRTVLLAPATFWQGGEAEEVAECRNPRCDYRTTRRRALPRRERDAVFGDGGPGIIILPPIGGWGGGSSGDSGGWGSGPDVGGFGGGESGGGGAGGDW